MKEKTQQLWGHSSIKDPEYLEYQRLINRIFRQFVDNIALKAKPVAKDPTYTEAKKGGK